MAGDGEAVAKITIKPRCFSVFGQPDDSYTLTKKDKHVMTITGAEDGNTKGI
ncbi:MAG: hypothetical protein LJE59_00545 [Chromatiaceae bacterium]|nr:hypothetical protein [Chromatiaceae bacterium]